MYSHVFVGVADFDRALAFYRALMPVLGLPERFCDRSRPWAGWQSAPGPRPLFLIGRPHDRAAHAAGNGQMVAWQATSRAVVDRAHAAALAHGGRCEGPPGLRPEYHPHYYGAYFRDTEGNKLCVACHLPDVAAVPDATVADAPQAPPSGPPSAPPTAPSPPPFATLDAADAPRVQAPDGSDVDVLPRLAGGSLARFSLPPGAVSAAVEHRTVEELWYVVAGQGQMWRRQGADESVVALRPGVSLSIPRGTRFQFRAGPHAALVAVAVTMPPWPGPDEALAVPGYWPAGDRG